MEPMPEGTRAIVDQAVDQAAQTLFSAPGVPLARTDELLAALQGPAVRAVFEARVEQIVKHGHSVDVDAQLPLGILPREARERLQMGMDCLGPPERRDLHIARRRFARSAALLLAAIDRLDVAIAEDDRVAAAKAVPGLAPGQ